jgi:hypothetical protein
MLFLTFYTLTGANDQQAKNLDKEHVPIPPNIDMVKAAIDKVPSDASSEEIEAVEFFYKNVIATLDNTVTTDAMCGESVMEALDVKTLIIRNKEEVHLVKAKKSTEMAARDLLEANVWVATMATGALLMDQRMGASDTESIVHNMLVVAGSDQKKKRPKQFNKGMAALRGTIYAEHYWYFLKIWEDNWTGRKGCEAATRLAQWDTFTGMTKKEVLSDAQKRAQRMPAYPDDNKENKKRKLNKGADSGLSQFFFKNLDPNRPPPLTGNDSNGGLSNGSPSSTADNDPLMEAQNKEEQANPSVLLLVL